MTRYATAFARPDATYRAIDLAGRTEGESASGLVALLYAEASRALRSAAWAAQHRRFEVRSERVTRAIAILFALENGLDHAAGEISGTLARLYQGARGQVANASLGTDPAPFLSVADTLDDIASAWDMVRH